MKARNMILVPVLFVYVSLWLMQTFAIQSPVAQPFSVYFLMVYAVLMSVILMAVVCWCALGRALNPVTDSVVISIVIIEISWVTWQSVVLFNILVVTAFIISGVIVWCKSE
jgi:hypothetical protein